MEKIKEKICTHAHCKCMNPLCTKFHYATCNAEFIKQERENEEFSPNKIVRLRVKDGEVRFLESFNRQVNVQVSLEYLGRVYGFAKILSGLEVDDLKRFLKDK